MAWKGGWGRGRQGALPGVRLAEPVHRATRSQRGVEALGAFRPALSPSVSFCNCSEYFLENQIRYKYMTEFWCP